MLRASRTPEPYELIWNTVKAIPRGKVATYGDIAAISGLLRQARRVGYALRATPPGLKIPWHRVINSQGKISFPKSNSNYLKQKKLLEKEGIVFKKDKIDLKKYRWIVTSK